MKESGAKAGRASRRRGMRGVAAIEFMIIMMILLPAFYVAVAYSITILARQMLTQAAAEGGRAMLRAGTLTQRQAYASSAVANVLTWPSASSVTTSVATDSTWPCPSSGATSTLTQCVMRVTLTMNQPLVASWPGLGSLVPSTVTGTAAVTLDVSTLSGT